MPRCCFSIGRFTNTWPRGVWNVEREQGVEAICELVDRKAWLPAWQEVIVMLGGMLGDVAGLLNLLADERRDDLFRHGVWPWLPGPSRKFQIPNVLTGSANELFKN